MSEEVKRYELSKPTEFVLRNYTLKVYPITLEKFLSITPKVEVISDPSSKPQDQIPLIMDVVYEIVNEDNPGMKKEDLQKVLTLEAGLKILQAALGQLAVDVPK